MGATLVDDTDISDELGEIVIAEAGPMPVELVEVDKELVTLEETDVELNPINVAKGMVEDVDEGVVEDIVVDETAVEDVVVVEDLVVTTPEQPILGSALFPVIMVVSSVVSVSPKKKKSDSKEKRYA